MRQTILISEITISSRIRKTVANISNLADSIRQHGLLQPIGIDSNKNLVWGYRRLCAHKHLGLDRIEYIDAKDCPEDERAELEFAENLDRENFTWQEECLGILDIYRKKKRRGALEGFKEYWQAVIAQRYNMSIGYVNYVLQVAKRLEDELALPEDKRKFWNSYQSAAEAHRLGILGELEDKANAILAQKAKDNANKGTLESAQAKAVVEMVQKATADPEVLQKERERYSSNPLNTVPFEKYWEEKQAEVEQIKNTVYLGNKILNVDAIEFMNREENLGRFDHIITDPPYAIDMDNLNQANQHGGLTNLDMVIDSHQVDENKTLLSRFFPAAFCCTKDNSFVVVCGDAMLWQLMYDAAITAGFAVQRWPYIWRKVNQSMMNNCAAYNTTKDFEIVMICRKPGATLAEKRNTSFSDCGNTEAKKVTGHPFAKPFELTRDLTQMVSSKGQTILEPFSGGGSMVIQMLRMERNIIALEKDERTYNQLLENVKREYYLKLNPKFIFK